MPSDQKRLESWKEIAAYLNREVRTARRWEKERGLPVYRIPGKRSGVYALAPEIDAWLKTKAPNPNGSSGDEVVEATAVPPRPGSRRLMAWMGVAAALAFAIVTLSMLPGAKSVPPHLSHLAVINNDGLLKGGLMGGGRSLFFISPWPELNTLQRINDSGGEASVIPFPSNKFGPLDVSRDGTRVLVIESDAKGCQWPLWVIPTSGGPPKRLADLCAGAAAWSPDGSRLAYTTGKDLYLSNADGSASRRLLALPFERPHGMRWSPDGKRLRLLLREGPDAAWFERLWEVNLGGATTTRILPGWSHGALEWEGGGEWTPDGRFFIFTAFHQGTSAIWAMREKRDPLGWRDADPMRLEAVQENIRSVTLSHDGKKVFAGVDLPRRCEVMRHEPGTGQFLRYTPMSGLSAGQLAFSQDGTRVVYVMYPDMSVWKANADGTNRLPVTSGSLHGALPRWSPDGQCIAFMGYKGNEPTKIRVVSAAGGPPQEPVQWPGWHGAPNWAAEGTELIFGENGPQFPIAASCSLHVFDFKSGKTIDLPGTSGLWTARTCPTGRYVAAMTRDNRTLVLYDRRTASRTDLLTPPEGQLGENPVWSADGRFVYIDVPFSRVPAVYRIRLANQRIERVAGLSGIPRTTWKIGAWIGLTPDGSLLTLRELQGTEIYAWDFVAP
jgi:Tol biopolymer transport system component